MMCFGFQKWIDLPQASVRARQYVLFKPEFAHGPLVAHRTFLRSNTDHEQIEKVGADAGGERRRPGRRLPCSSRPVQLLRC